MSSIEENSAEPGAARHEDATPDAQAQAATEEPPQEVETAGAYVSWAGGLFVAAVALALIASDMSANGDSNASGTSILAGFLLVASLVVGVVGLRRHVRNADLVATLLVERLRAEAAAQAAEQTAPSEREASAAG